MNRNLVKYIFTAILVFLLSCTFVLFKSYAQTTTTTNTTATNQTSLTDKALAIYTSNSCEFCKDLETELKSKYDSSSYSIKNIDTSDQAKKDYQIGLVTCGQKSGTVPMFFYQNTCVSGKDAILSIMEDVNSANALKTQVTTDIKKANTLISGLNDFSNLKLIDQLAWYDYALAATLLSLFVLSIALIVKNRKSVNKRAKLIAYTLFGLSMVGIGVLIYFKIQQNSAISATSANAGKTVKTCLTTNTCKDWNEYVKAQAKVADNNGDGAAKKEWESKIVDQSVLNQQIAAQNNALISALSDPKNSTNNSKYCGKSTCTYAEFLDYQSKALRECTTTECKTTETKNYLTALYGSDKNQALGGYVKDAITDYNNLALQSAVKQFKDSYTGNDTGLNSMITQLRAYCNKLTAAERGDLNCGNATQDQLISNFAFKFIPTDNYTGIGVYVPNVSIWTPTTSDECIVPTSGGACPKGTATCTCQTTPVKRSTCAALGQSCYNVCLATHNVCQNCTSKDRQPVTQEDVTPPTTPDTPSTPSNPTAPVCQEACSSDNPCSDGTSCISGKCVNPSCEDSTTCSCGSTPTESSNPNWDIEKTASVVCINNNTTNAYAQVKFNISATYSNTDSPTTVGTLERVIDRPENYKTSWLDESSINNDGTVANNGSYVDTITWDLTGTLSQFTIPSGETSITKSNFLKYTFNVPKEAFGSYVNVVTGYPNQDSDEGSFSNTNSIYIACTVPGTATFSQTIIITILGIILVGMGLMFAYTQKGDRFIFKVANSDTYDRISIALASRENKKKLKKQKFEKEVLK